MRPAPIPAVLLLAVLPSACSSDKKASDTADPTADEARYVAAARPFMESLVAQDHAKAYGFGSSHLRERMTLDAFTQKNREAYASLGTPLRLADGVSAETDPAILVGAAHATGDDELEKAANRMLAEVALGDLPESIPASIRKASVTAHVVTAKAEDAEEGEDPFYVLTVVLVDDAGQLRVGHYFFRAASMLDD
jgi:hypothetical protein